MNEWRTAAQRGIGKHLILHYLVQNTLKKNCCEYWKKIGCEKYIENSWKIMQNILKINDNSKYIGKKIMIQNILKKNNDAKFFKLNELN